MTDSSPQDDLPDPGNVERIGLHRSYAVIKPDSITVKSSRSGLIGPAIQAVITVVAVWALITYMATWPMWLLVILLFFALISGPTAVLGLVYNLMGSSFVIERPKQTARWQQGFLGLGLGTHELVPFHRMKRIEVSGDFEDELGSGDLQDVVQWEVRLVKDNDRLLRIGLVAAARPLAEEALARANALARATAQMAGVEVREGTLPDWAYEDEEFDELEDHDLLDQELDEEPDEAGDFADDLDGRPETT
jgi:hypothetical protein